MPIEANVSGGSPITASVGETQIDVSVSGGFGPSGANGSAGAAATIAVGSVTTGAAGSSASVTNAGSSSAAVFNFTIPAGATGPQGPAGPAGSNATLPTATASVLGGVKIGSGVAIDGDGVISVAAANQDLDTTDSPTFASVTLSSGELNSGTGYVTIESDAAVVSTPAIAIIATDGPTVTEAVYLGVRGNNGGDSIPTAFVQSLNNRLRFEQGGGGLGTVAMAGIKFADNSEQTAAWTGTVDAGNVTGLATVATSGSYANLDDLPTLFDGEFSSLTSIPTTLSGYGITDAAATSHTHGAGDITSGTLAAARLPIVLEQTHAVGNSGTSTTLALTTGSVQTVTLNGNCTFTMPTATAGASITLILTQGGTNTATFTGVLWAGGTAPTITATASKRDILVFVSNGTSWFGTAAQNF
jgi:hypothetical protein